jgi:hypothetical protein
MGIPAGHFWGVNSFMKITKTNVAIVKNRTGQLPDFWGRFIGIPASFTGPSELTEGEVDVLRAQDPPPRFFLIYNAANLVFHVGVNNAGAKGPRRDPDKLRKLGKDDAIVAMARANLSGKSPGEPNFNVPDGTPIFANIEQSVNGDISPDWIQGWCEAFLGTRFKNGGIYGFFGPNRPLLLGEAYTAARAKMGVKPPLWAAVPHRGRFAKPSEINFTYVPEEPVGSAGTAVIWQYETAWLGKGSFDTNLATQRGFDLMGQLSPALTGDAVDPNPGGIEPGTTAFRQPDIDRDRPTQFPTRDPQPGPLAGLEASGTGESG